MSLFNKDFCTSVLLLGRCGIKSQPFFFSCVNRVVSFLLCGGKNIPSWLLPSFHLRLIYLNNYDNSRCMFLFWRAYSLFSTCHWAIYFRLVSYAIFEFRAFEEIVTNRLSLPVLYLWKPIPSSVLQSPFTGVNTLCCLKLFPCKQRKLSPVMSTYISVFDQYIFGDKPKTLAWEQRIFFCNKDHL